VSIIALGVSIWRNLTSSNVNIKHIEKEANRGARNSMYGFGFVIDYGFGSN